MWAPFAYRRLRERFDLVVEVNNIHSLPPDARGEMVRAMRAVPLTAPLLATRKYISSSMMRSRIFKC